MPISEEPFVFQASDALHARTLARLEDEQIGWLGTTGRDGFPHAVPVWFLWRDGRVIVFSEPATAKVRNIRADDRVVFHLEGGEDGEQIAVLRGRAAISPEETAAWLDAIGEEYGRKYAGGLEGLHMSLADMAARYTVVLEITPYQLIAW
ncbi:pyridoxamine 5'-phosphate oxidase family protein [Microbacterium pygmaeum]|uniref:PPOX class probable F420-dependent enzyme, Rv3369 family n=1 Tax=Microbacterium pygmaeum TaxID=370764 RepID=A0A1G7W6C8_9MICO|nr:pyridoxamine 5'-phosphate oxidase family protein [Microbacterium pygmaeum]SDG67555.1 PPOX class probable F420-dependent enzyme, Rv3369 family [Microbacterium pygmaeum]